MISSRLSYLPSRLVAADARCACIVRRPLLVHEKLCFARGGRSSYRTTLSDGHDRSVRICALRVCVFVDAGAGSESRYKSSLVWYFGKAQASLKRFASNARSGVPNHRPYSTPCSSSCEHRAAYFCLLKGVVMTSPFASKSIVCMYNASQDHIVGSWFWAAFLH